MKKTLFLTLIALVIGFGIYLFAQTLREAETPVDLESMHTGTVTVTYENGAFQPATLTVPAGQRVVFLNTTTRSIWVASDPHPVHTSFPALESGLIRAGGEYSFTFSEPGIIEYHNHLNPGATGTIIVE